MAKGYTFSPKTLEEIQSAKDAIKSIRKTQGKDAARAMFDAIKNSDWGKSVRQENTELGKQMQTDRDSVAGFVAEKDALDAREQTLIQELEGVKKAREVLLEHLPRIQKLKAKLGLPESAEELQEALKQYILQKSAAIAHEVREHNQFVDREVGGIAAVFPNNDNQKAVERKEVTFVGNPEEKDMKSGEKLLIQPMLIDGVEWTALKIPASIKEMKLSDLSEEFMEKKDEKGFPEMDMTVSVGEALGSDWLILAKHNKKTGNGKTSVNIQAYNKSANTDVVRECLREGTKPMGLAHTLVLREIITQGLGDEYVDFPGYKADSDENGYENIRAMIEKIDDYTALSLGDYIDVGNGKIHIVRNLGVYRDKNDNLKAFVRGGSGVGGCASSVASVRLYGDVGNSNTGIGFRSGL